MLTGTISGRWNYDNFNFPLYVPTFFAMINIDVLLEMEMP